MNSNPYTAVGSPLTEFEARPLWQLLTDSASRFPDRTALIFKDFQISYRDLNILVGRVSAGIQALGIKPGDRVGICMPNHPISVIAFFATIRAGAVVVMMNPIYAAPALVGQAKDAALSMLITLDESMLRNKAETVANQAGVRTLVVASTDVSALTAGNSPEVRIKAQTPVDFDTLLLKRAEPTSVECDPTRDLIAIQYSGGTTGSPKGVMLTHANLCAAVRQFQMTLPQMGIGTEVFLGAAPFFHISGMGSMLCPAIAWAATILIIDRFDATETAKSCIAHRVTYFAAVPTMFLALGTITESLSLEWPDLKCAVSGGAPLPESVKCRFESVVGKPILHSYGLTECSPPVTMPPLDRAVPAACCGEPVPGTEIQIRSTPDATDILPPGETGELCVRGPQVTPGYWERPEFNREVFIDGFIRTGDLAYTTGDNLIFLVDRLKDIIICSGFNVYPTRVEEALLQHPSISEAIVLGVPDPYRGETVKAFITVREGETLTLKELQEFLVPLLSPIEMPKQLEVREELPRTPVGKLSRLKLREEVAARPN
jgi:long-chain acyl-CoA synthetase